MMRAIPKIIHLTCKEKPVPARYQPYLKSIQKLHPEWEVRIYDDIDCREVIRINVPSMLGMYDNYAFSVQRTDIFRIIIVYFFGGFYLDFDIHCFKKLDSLISLPLVLGEEKTLTDDEKKQLNLKQALRIANYMFGSVPGHPFWVRVIEAAAAVATEAINAEDDILETTGPGLLTRVYHQVGNDYRDIVVLRNTDRKCVRNCREASCHFGDYAAHTHMGSWRWQNKRIQSKVSETGTAPVIDIQNIFCELKRKADKIYKQNSTDLLILETYPSAELPYDGLTGIYNEIKAIGQIVSDTTNIEGATVLVCGIATLNSKRVSPKNKNIIFTTFESDRLPHDWVLAINYYQYCIVPDLVIKDVFVSSGVSIPIAVIHQGFRRFKRTWRKLSLTPHFNVGFLGIPVSRKNLNKLYMACKALRDEGIPTIKLVVHVSSFYSWLSERAFQEMKKDDMVVWSDGRLSEEELSYWFSNLSCYVFPSSGEGWSYTPRESLYLGIPTIISDIPLHKDLLASGYYVKIKSSKKELANFNGRTHGCWSKIETEEIKGAIKEVYNNYTYCQKNAQKGAEWISDKWLNEDLRQQLLKFISTI